MWDKTFWLSLCLIWVAGIIWIAKLSAPYYYFIIFGFMLAYCIFALGYGIYYETKSLGG